MFPLFSKIFTNRIFFSLRFVCLTATKRTIIACLGIKIILYKVPPFGQSGESAGVTTVLSVAARYPFW